MSAKIAQALHGVMTKCGYVQKTGKNQFHGYRYAGEADLLDKLRPAMIEEGLLLLPSGKTITGPDEHGNVHVAMEYTLAHKDGDIWPEKLVAFGAGNDRAKNGSVGDKGVYKAITGANKYLLFKLFQIETGDDPEEQAEAPPPPPARKPNVNPYAKSPKADELIEEMHKQGDVAALKTWKDEAAPVIEKLPDPEYAKFKAAYQAHGKWLSERREAAE